MLDNLKKYDIVLASNSPRRRELLSRLGIDFRVFTLMGIDETFPKGLSKAGSYGIQEWIGMAAVEEIYGSYFNVIGLPIQRLYQALKDF